MKTRLRPTGSRGFSLLEMLVAVAILGVSLGMLYQSVSSSTKTQQLDAQYAYATELAKSLRSEYSVVPLQGLRIEGAEMDDYVWSVEATPLELPPTANLVEGKLQNLSVAVGWRDGLKERSVELQSIATGNEFAEE